MISNQEHRITIMKVTNNNTTNEIDFAENLKSHFEYALKVYLTGWHFYNRYTL